MKFSKRLSSNKLPAVTDSPQFKLWVFQFQWKNQWPDFENLSCFLLLFILNFGVFSKVCLSEISSWSHSKLYSVARIAKLFSKFFFVHSKPEKQGLPEKLNRRVTLKKKTKFFKTTGCCPTSRCQTMLYNTMFIQFGKIAFVPFDIASIMGKKSEVAARKNQKSFWVIQTQFSPNTPRGVWIFYQWST